MTAEQLAQCVTERIWMTRDIAGREKACRLAERTGSAARARQLEGAGGQWQARLDEAEAAVEQAVRKRRNALHRYRPKADGARCAGTGRRGQPRGRGAGKRRSVSASII